MAVVPRETRNGIVYWVCTSFEGKPYWERVGKDEREARRLDARREKEKKHGTYKPPEARTGRLTVRAYADRWLVTRTNRSADLEQKHINSVLLDAPDLAAMPMERVQARDVLAAVAHSKARGRAPRSVKNMYGVLRVMCRNAVLNGAADVDPFAALPPGTFSTKGVVDKSPHTGAEVAALLSERVPLQRRVLVALAFYTGMRIGEICGRRWRNILGAKPLDALVIDTQYQDEPLKGDDDQIVRPRKVPIHPALHELLAQWFRAWSEAYGRAPTLDDLIVPSTQDPRLAYTQSGGRKVWQAACASVGIKSRGPHIARHTFTTNARRCYPHPDVIESITHNASGRSIDHYNHWQWDPLCEAVRALNFAADLDQSAGVSAIFGSDYNAPRFDSDLDRRLQVPEIIAPAVGLEPTVTSLIPAERPKPPTVRHASLIAQFSKGRANLRNFGPRAAHFGASQEIDPLESARIRASDAALSAYLRALADRLAELSLSAGRA